MGLPVTILSLDQAPPTISAEAPTVGLGKTF